MDLQDGRDLALIVASVAFIAAMPLLLYLLLQIARAVLQLVEGVNRLSQAISEGAADLLAPITALRRALEAAAGPLSGVAGAVSSLFRGEKPDDNRRAHE